jgi:hypothetical protein
VPSRAEKTIIDTLFDPERFNFSVTPNESSEEMTARLKHEADEGEHRRRKDLLLTQTGIAVIGIGFLAALVVAIFPIGAAEEKTKAWTILTMIVAGFIGFLTGRQFPAEPPEGRR